MSSRSNRHHHDGNQHSGSNGTYESPGQRENHDSGRDGQHNHDKGHHAHMAYDFRRRLWFSLILTIPILALSPMIREFVGVTESLAFPGDLYLLAALSTALFLYGGWPFLTGLVREVRNRRPGMMTLVGVAITTSFSYSTSVVFGVPGKIFYWELATLVDVMLLGHWVEMRSVMGASKALEELARLMPSDAHRVLDGGEV